MKLSSFITLGAVAAAICSCNSRPADRFDIKGSIEGADGQTIYLVYSANDSLVKDSAVIENGAFAFSGTIANPTQASIYSGNPTWGSQTMLRIYMEPAEMSVSGLKADDFSGAVISGSKTQAEVDSLDNVLKPITEQFKTLGPAMQNADEAGRAAIEAQIDSLRQIYNAEQKDFITTHPASFYTVDLLRMQMSGLSYDELKQLYEGLTPEVQAAAKEVSDELTALESVLPGKPAPDLIGENQNGEPTKLSDLKGKVVLVDFWATWCGPCRASLPHIKELYEKYNSKGFEVFCVADNDSNPDVWKTFIEESKDGMQNYHHILRGLKQSADGGFDRSNDQSSKYAVHYLPTKYLIAADGTVIGKFDDSEAMDAKLAEIFAE